MSTDFDKKKEDFVNALNAKYPDEEQKWWQFGFKVYSTTWVEAANSNLSDCNGDTITIKGNLTKSVLLACVFGAMIVIQVVSKTKLRHFDLLITIPFFLDLVLDILNRKPRIVLSCAGIWFNNGCDMIPWNNIAASYIKKQGNDWSFLHLQLHFYDPFTDVFKKIEYPLKRLSMSFQDLSFYIEWWKITTKASLIQNTKEQL
jgi:hypothetical protein